MFTGIITATGRIKKIKKDKSFILTIETNKNFVKKAKLGNSIAVDGVCLTVAKIKTTPNPSLKRRGTKGVLTFELMPETVRLTLAGGYKVGTIVNLEQSMRVGDEIGGHFVAGHVDGVGKVVKIRKEKESAIITIKPPNKLLKYLAHKGSVAVDGVSLTIINPSSKSTNFNISLVTYTLEHTNLSKLKIGTKINIEVDLLARYVEKMKI